MNGGGEEEEEDQWFDVFIRRPQWYYNNRDAAKVLPSEPTEVFTRTYNNDNPPHNENNSISITLTLKGFQKDSEQTMVSSGLAEWGASDHLCNYLLTDDGIISNRRQHHHNLCELGAGIGKCGLLAHKLLSSVSSSSVSTVLTDGDTNALQLLRQNVAQNTNNDDVTISCQKLAWGAKEARVFLSQRQDDDMYNPDDMRKFDTILGSDLLYTNRTNLNPLFDTVEELIHDDRGRFILAHNEQQLIPVEDVKSVAYRHNLFCEVLLKGEGGVYILCFRRPSLAQVTNVVNRLQDGNTTLALEKQALENRVRFLEEKCKGLEERCTVLRGEEHLPNNILLSLVDNEDNLAEIAAYLEPKHLSCLASTCKFFSAKEHNIHHGEASVSLMEKIAYKLFEEASPWEKEVLLFARGASSPFILYDELLKLREPLKFDKLLGSNIKTTTEMEGSSSESSTLQPRFTPGVVKRIPGQHFYWACTAVSNYVMRGTGKHYVTFTCSDPVKRLQHASEPSSPLWFGLVRPLQELQSSRSIFTPFSSSCVPSLKRVVQRFYPEWAGNGNNHCCVYNAKSGQSQWTCWGLDNNDDGNDDDFSTEDWDGMQSFDGNGKIGLLLDYEEKTLTVFLNDVKLGVMRAGNLSGPYCWMVTVGSWFRSYSEDIFPKIRIERGTPLASDDESSPHKAGPPQKMLRKE